MHSRLDKKYCTRARARYALRVPSVTGFRLVTSRGSCLRATVPEAVETVSACMEAFRTSDLDCLLDIIPDEVVDYLVEQRRSHGREEAIQFQDVLETDARQAMQQHFVLDSYALRNLVYARPASYAPLSSMLVSPTKFVQRCAVNSKYGEETIVTISLDLQESLQPQYRGVRMATRWMLRSITGENSCDELPEAPTPSAPPEAIVQAQLAALREGDFATTFSFASPENQQATGPLDKFAGMFQTLLYSSLVHHVKYKSLNRMQVSEVTYMELVHVTGKALEETGQTPQAIYLWILSQQADTSRMRGCWMTDSVDVFRIL